MTLLSSESMLNGLFSYAYMPVPWPVGLKFRFGYNILAWAAIAQLSEAEVRA
jgi:hypothetical protein